MPAVGRNDLRRVLGELDDPRMFDILALDPSIDDLEQALVVATGDQDVLARRGHDVSATAVKIAEILAADEDDEDVPPKAGPDPGSDA
jgi:hypothetical protein